MSKISSREVYAVKSRSRTNLKTFLDRHPSRPWSGEELSKILQELIASDLVGVDSDSSDGGFDETDLGILQSSARRHSDKPRLSHLGRNAVEGKGKMGEKRASGRSKDFGSLSLQSGSARRLKAEDRSLRSVRQLRSSSPHQIRASSLKMIDSEALDLGKLNARIRKPKVDGELELPPKIVPRVAELVESVQTAMKYNLEPENIKDEYDFEEKVELKRITALHRRQSLGPKDPRKKSFEGFFIRGIPTFRYEAIRPKKDKNAVGDQRRASCGCKICKMDLIWVETKRRKADNLAPLLGEARPIIGSRNTVWTCQCPGPRAGFTDKNQMTMKIRIPPSMTPAELKKLNAVPRAEISKHVYPAVVERTNIKTVTHKLPLTRPLIQQELMCHTNGMRCVLLPPPFTAKVTKFETPDWVITYNKRYVYDHFAHLTKNLPNVSFMDFSYKKTLAVLVEEIIQGCLSRTDIFDEDTCQCTFLCTCAHKTAKPPNATLFDTVRQAKKYCAADLYDGRIYEAGDHTKAGDKTYFVCSRLCNAKMKLHKQLHI